MNTAELIQRIQVAKTPEQIRESNLAYAQFMQEATDKNDIQTVKEARANALTLFLDEVEKEQQETLRFLALNGKQYDLSDWLTPAEYARHYGLRSANNVTNWMARGIIPASDMLEIPEFNGLRLVRNKSYKETAAKTGG